MYFGTWVEEDDVGTKRRLLNSGQTSVVALSAQYNLQNYHWPVYPVLSHPIYDTDAYDFVHRMHKWREFFWQRTAANRATAPPTAPNHEIPLPAPPVKPNEPGIPSAGHSSLSNSVTFEELGKATHGSNAKEEENEDGVKEDGNTDKKHPVKDRNVEGRFLHTVLKKCHKQQQTPRPRATAPIIMSWNGVVEYPDKQTATIPTPSPMDSQHNSMHLLQLATQLMPDFALFNQPPMHNTATQQNCFDSLLMSPPFSSPTPLADFNASTCNSYDMNSILTTPTLIPIYDTPTWNVLTPDVPLQFAQEPDFPAAMGLQSLPFLDPLLLMPFPSPATTNDWNYNIAAPSAEFLADWLTAPAPDALSTLGLEFLLPGGV
ncbi:hypothetical protein HDU77_011691 [Chytriomyces hyalinus]|nr:hypothetical protein HDU77_011691 [Chytriomyces hyalinus]